MDYRIQKALEVIENNYPQSLTTASLAKSVNLSISRFQHLFQMEVGTSVAQYIKNFRLQKARALLETSDMSIKELRVKIGLAGKTHFFRDYRRKFGLSPCQFRKNNRLTAKTACK